MQELLQYTLDSTREDINIVKSSFGLRETRYAAIQAKTLLRRVLKPFVALNKATRSPASPRERRFRRRTGMSR